MNDRGRERETLRTCRRAIERVLLLHSVEQGRVRSTAELILHAEILWGEGVEWLLDEPAAFTSGFAIHVTHGEDAFLVDCKGNASLAIGFELLDVVTALAHSTNRATVVVSNVVRPHLLSVLTPIGFRRDVSLLSLPISRGVAVALGAPAHGTVGGDCLIVAVGPQWPAQFEMDWLAAAVGSPVTATAVRSDLHLDRECHRRLLDLADHVLIPDDERFMHDAGIISDPN